MINHLSCSAKSERVFLLYKSNIKCHLLTNWKGSLGVYYSQINTCLTEVCLHFFPSSEVRKKQGVHVTVEKGRQNYLSESPQELVQR